MVIGPDERKVVRDDVAQRDNRETPTAHPSGMSPSQGKPVKRRLALVSVTSALMVVVAQPAFAIVNMVG